MYTPFWFNQPSILYDKNYIFEFFPIKEYDLIRKLNSIQRFTIYYSIIIEYLLLSSRVYSYIVILMKNK